MQGLAPTALIQHAKPGSVFTVIDKAIDFPNERLPNAGPRSTHYSRVVIVVTAKLRCTSSQPNTLCVIPCSTSHQGRVGDWDLEVPIGETCFKDRTVAYASLVQPILKSDLDKHYGDVSSSFLFALQQVLLSNMGIIGSTPKDVQEAAETFGKARQVEPK